MISSDGSGVVRLWVKCFSKVISMCSFNFFTSSVQFSSVESLSRVRLFVTPWITAHQASLSITNSQSLLKLNVHWVSDAIQPSHPLSSPSPLLHLQSFPASGSFPMSQFSASGDQSIEVSASPSVFPMNVQDWFPLELTGLVSLLFKGLSRVFSNTTVQRMSIWYTWRT